MPPEADETARFVSEQGGVFAVTEEDLVAEGLGQVTLAEYVDVVVSMLETNVQGFELVSREEALTEQGLPVVVLECAIQGGLWRASRQIYLHENSVAFNTSYFAARARYEELEPMIAYSLGTVQVVDAELD
jgi:hypothetical protein